MIKMPLHTLALATVVLVFSSCLGPSMINKWVNQQYGNSVSSSTKKKDAAITVNTNLGFSDDKLSHTEKKTSKLLPLIVYWQYDYVNTCTLNPKIPVAAFTSAVNSYSHNNTLKQKLNGNQLELTVEKIPGSFVIDDKGHIIWIIYAISWERISIKNLDRELTVSYRVLNGTTEIKKGTVSVTGSEKEVPLGMFQSLKRKTKEFMTANDNNTKALAKLAMDKIVSEL